MILFKTRAAPVYFLSQLLLMLTTDVLCWRPMICYCRYMSIQVLKNQQLFPLHSKQFLHDFSSIAKHVILDKWAAEISSRGGFPVPAALATQMAQPSCPTVQLGQLELTWNAET